MLTVLLVFTSAVAAFALSSFVGGGASIILIPVLASIVPISEVPGALVIGTFTSSASRLVSLRRKIRWDLVSVFVPAALPAVALGAWLLSYVDPLVISWISALFLISNLPLLFRSERFSPGKVAHTRKPLIAGIGVVAGLLSGLTGAVGLVFNRFYLESGLTKEEIVATRAANEILLHLLKLILYYNLGLFSANSVTIGFLIALAALLSTMVARALLPYVNDCVFRRTGYAAMIASGIFLFTQSSKDILTDRKPSVTLTSVSDGFETRAKWAGKTITLEFEYDGDFSIERVVSVDRLSPTILKLILPLTFQADHFVVEEVFGWSKHYYEVYVYQGNQEKKYEVALGV